MGMVSRGLYNTTDVWLSAKSSVLSSLSDLLVLVLCVADFTDRCPASVVDHSHFARWQSEGHIVAFLCHHLRGSTGGADHLATLLRLEFNVVNQSTKRDVSQFKAVSWEDVCTFTADDLHAINQALWSQDVSLFAIAVFQQCDSAGSIRIVFDTDHGCFKRIFLSLKVDDSVASLVTASLVKARSATLVVATATLWQCNGQALFRLLLCDFFVGRRNHVPSAR